MTYLKKVVKICQGKTGQWIAKWIRYIPLSSKYIGPPKGYYISSEVYWDSYKKNDLSGLNYELCFPSSISQRNCPKSIAEIPHWKFDGQYSYENPETFIISIPDGRVFGSMGAIITHDDKLILDVSLEFGIGNNATKVDSHHVFKYPKLPKCQEIPETIAVLATAGGDNYFHWLTDALPRVEIIKKTFSNGTKNINKYVVNKGFPIIEESLEILGISKDMLIFIDSKQQVQAKNLVVPSLVGSTGNPPAWVCTFLRENFLKHKADIPVISKLYISRSKARYRKVTNEEDVLECLTKFGFTPVWLEEHNFATQIALFSNAEYIVAPHGAGLTNLMWCNSSAKILELFSPNYVNVCFWAIANQIGLEYFYLIGNGKKPPNYFDPHLGEDNINISIEELNQSLKIVLKQ
jgi:capsular polysaccharide biosynthesis protein